MEEEHKIEREEETAAHAKWWVTSLHLRGSLIEGAPHLLNFINQEGDFREVVFFFVKELYRSNYVRLNMDRGKLRIWSKHAQT